MSQQIRRRLPTDIILLVRKFNEERTSRRNLTGANIRPLNTEENECVPCHTLMQIYETSNNTLLELRVYFKSPVPVRWAQNVSTELTGVDLTEIESFPKTMIPLFHWTRQLKSKGMLNHLSTLTHAIILKELTNWLVQDKRLPGMSRTFQISVVLNRGLYNLY